MPTRPTILGIRACSFSSPTSVQGTSTSLTSPNTIIPSPSPYSSSSSSPYKAQCSTSASVYPAPSEYSSSSSYSIAGELLSIQTTGINGRKSFGELAREVQKIVRPPRERARGRGGMKDKRDEKTKGKGGGREILCELGMGRGANRGRTYAGVAKQGTGKDTGKKKGQKKRGKVDVEVEVDVEAGLRRTICTQGQVVSGKDKVCKCDCWKLVPRGGAGAGSVGILGTKMVVCNHFIELLKQRYANEDE
ncbi:hypothetical protein L873DRAFT_1794779 [Choiromyces venosus 120613-1]|uniref:Uncharacterized protein n=1 Tax=Choiromyces venosus 120613-1 TaxID=1336337 RepID=A0A3N4J0E7_9PEZI|nr:hypothetical protein L873DRAFT_1794779 [Choiromyces venosus 120613-1]